MRINYRSAVWFIAAVGVIGSAYGVEPSDPATYAALAHLPARPATASVASESAPARGLALAGPKRPANVPADFVITPFGYFHPSCVTHLANGDNVRRDQKVIQHADGTNGENLHECAYPHYKTDGEAIVGEERATAKEPSIGHSWIEYSSTTTSTSYAYMYTNFNVPPAPTNNDGQTVFLFPGMEDYKDVVTIIQPVLGWNSDYANAWGIASWNCCVSGTTFEAPPSRVNSGEIILGYMFDTCAAGTLSCPTWDIVTYDVTKGNFSELLNTSSQGQTFNWAFSGALEVYNIAQCGDYPGSGFVVGANTTFYNTTLFDDGFAKIAKPSWSETNLSANLTPQCSYGGSLTQESTLSY